MLEIIPHTRARSVRVRFQIIGNARISNVGKSQSCMVSKLVGAGMLNLAELGVPGVSKVDSGDIGEILRLNQNWVMYSPPPPLRSGWWRVTGELANATGGNARI